MQHGMQWGRYSSIQFESIEMNRPMTVAAKTNDHMQDLQWTGCSNDWLIIAKYSFVSLFRCRVAAFEFWYFLFKSHKVTNYIRQNARVRDNRSQVIHASTLLPLPNWYSLERGIDRSYSDFDVRGNAHSLEANATFRHRTETDFVVKFTHYDVELLRNEWTSAN